MNKGRRNELAALKRKKRLKLYKADPSQKWTHKLKNHATICSCYMCSHRKYNRARIKEGATIIQMYSGESRGWANEKP
jgi:hypothetical protein